MPYDILEDHPECGSDEVGLVVRQTQKLVACHPNEASAIDQIAAIQANEEKEMGLLPGAYGKGVKDRSTARSASKIRWSDRSRGEWAKPSFGDFVRAMGWDAEQVDDLSTSQKRTVALRSIAGAVGADTWEDLYSYPVVDENGVLYRRAAINAKARSRHHPDSNGIENTANALLDEFESEDSKTMAQPSKGSPSGTDHVVGPSGGALKDLNDKGLFGGYLIRFGSPKEHDLERDFFTKETDFWLKDGEGESATLWAHGTDPKIGKKRIDKGWGKLVLKDAGVWMETQLQKRNEYEEAIQKLAEKGKLGLSSGTASHLVQRERTKEGPDGVTHIKQWPLGLDGSATPTPAEPRTGVQPLKSLSFPSIKELAMGASGTFAKEGMDEDDVEEAVQAMKAVSMREKRRLIKSDFTQQFSDGNDPAPRPKAVFDSFIIARGRRDERKVLFRVPYSGAVQEGYTFADRDDWTEVVKTERFTEPSVAKELKELNEKFFGSRNGPGNEDEDLESTLDSLVELTS